MSSRVAEATVCPRRLGVCGSPAAWIAPGSGSPDSSGGTVPAAKGYSNGAGAGGNRSAWSSFGKGRLKRPGRTTGRVAALGEAGSARADTSRGRSACSLGPAGGSRAGVAVGDAVPAARVPSGMGRVPTGADRVAQSASMSSRRARSRSERRSLSAAEGGVAGEVEGVRSAAACGGSERARADEACASAGVAAGVGVRPGVGVGAGVALGVVAVRIARCNRSKSHQIACVGHQGDSPRTLFRSILQRVH